MSSLVAQLPSLDILEYVLALVPAAIEFYTDWLWFGETGYQRVFLSEHSTAGGVRPGLYSSRSETRHERSPS